MLPIEQKKFMGLPTETRRDLIRQEVTAQIERDHGFRQLNNFYANLSGGSRRKLCERAGIMDIPNRDIRKESLGKTQQSEDVSDIWWNQTPRQFFQEIDDTIIDLGIPIHRIQNFQRKHDEVFMKDPGLRNKEHRKKARAILNQIYDLILPVFIELRVKGYSHQDLAR